MFMLVPPHTHTHTHTPAMMEEELTNGEEENNHLEDHIQGSQQVA
jgi:hypothetical protein